MVADYFAEHYHEIPRIPLKELCRAIGVSEPTIFRFCNDMGFAGIKDLKLYLASVNVEQEPPRLPRSVPEISETVDDQDFRFYINRILHAEEKILTRTISHIDIAALRKAAAMLIGSSHIVLYGLGSSQLVCQDAVRKLMRMQISAWAMTDEGDVENFLKNGHEKNLLFCISHTGASQQVVNAMREAHNYGVPTLLMTSYPQSAAAKYADFTLQTYAMEEITTRVGMTSRISQFAVLDSLVMIIARMIEKNLFVKMDTDSQTVLSND